MKFGLTKWLVLFGAMTAISSASIATTINFDNLADQTIVTSQYAAIGATFNGPAVLDSTDLGSGFPTHSGSNALVDESLQGPVDPIIITFTNPVTNVNAFFTYDTQLTLQAFDAITLVDTELSSSDANFLGSGNDNPNEQIFLSGLNITSVVISGDTDNGNSFTMDDLTFTNNVQTNPTPEPSSAIITGIGCLMIGLLAMTRSLLQKAN